MPTSNPSPRTPDPTLQINRTNTILYCAGWADTVEFYRTVIGLRSTFENDWFVEFEIAGGAHLSVADAARATIEPSGGDGLTLSWEVADLEAARHRLAGRGVVASEPIERWDALSCFLHDPEGNRLELWSSIDEPDR